MEVEMVLNELSLIPADDVQTARLWMSSLVETILMATRKGVRRSIRTHSDLDTIILAPDYPLVRWRNDKAVNQDIRRALRLLTTKTPLLQGLEYDDISHKVTLSDAFLEQKPAIGLSVAYWLEALAISLPSELRWQTYRLTIKITQLDADGELFDITENVYHASHSDHVLKNLDWISERSQIIVRNGSELWQQKEQLFPHLRFCASVEQQMNALLTGNIKISVIRKALHKLEQYCTTWTEGNFNYKNIPCTISSDSSATLQKYNEERMFLCPDGETRIFTWHIKKLSSDEWRIYFHPDPQRKEIIIGYIGKHLNTVLYKV